MISGTVSERRSFRRPAKQWKKAKAKLDKTMASLSPWAREAMAGVTTIMNAKLEALAVNCTIRRR